MGVGVGSAGEILLEPLNGESREDVEKIKGVLAAEG